MTPERPLRRTWSADDVKVQAIFSALLVLVVGCLAVRNESVSGFEESVFRAVNDLPDWLYRPIWPFTQLGAIAIGPLVAIVALVLRRYRLAIAALIITVLKLVSERAIKAIVSRQRPGTSIGPNLNTRGDVHLTGESFVSGHAVLIAAGAGRDAVPARALEGRAVGAVALVMVGRVCVGRGQPARRHLRGGPRDPDRRRRRHRSRHPAPPAGIRDARTHRCSGFHEAALKSCIVSSRNAMPSRI